MKSKTLIIAVVSLAGFFFGCGSAFGQFRITSLTDSNGFDFFDSFQQGTGANDRLRTSNPVSWDVNDQNIHNGGTDTWTTADRIENISINGSLDLSGVDFLNNDVMVVFKDGNFKTNGNNQWGGFLISQQPMNDGILHYTSSKPSNTISHATIYTRSGGSPLPPSPSGDAPVSEGTLALLAVIGFAVFARRRR